MATNILQEFIIKFKTLFSGEGAKDAKKGVEEVGQSAEQSGKRFKKFGSDAKAGGMASGEAIGAASAATKLLHGNVLEAATGLRGLIKLFPMLAAVAGPIGIAIAAVGGLVKVFEAVQVKLIQAQEAIAKIKVDNLTSQVRRAQDAVYKLRNEYDEATEARKRFEGVEDSAKASKRRLEDATAEYSYQERLAGLTPGDEAARTRLEAEENFRKAQLRLARELEDAQTQNNRLVAEEEDAAAKVNLLFDERIEKLKQLTKAHEEYARVADLAKSATMEKNAQSYIKQAEALQPLIDKLSGDIADIDRSLESERLNRDVARAKQAEYQTEVATSRMVNRGSKDAYDRAGKTADSQEDKAINETYDKILKAAEASSDERMVGMVKQAIDILTVQNKLSYEAMTLLLEQVQKGNVSWQQISNTVRQQNQATRNVL